MSLFQFIEWLNETPWSTWLRENDLAFPIIESVHIIALAFSFGTIMWLDLRLMGLILKRERVSDVIAQIEPWAIRGFSVMFASGILLFLSEPMKCYTTLAFQLKALLIVVALLNILWFHSKVSHSISSWDEGGTIPWQARTVGFLSFMLWMAIIVLGRWTAYS